MSYNLIIGCWLLFGKIFCLLIFEIHFGSSRALLVSVLRSAAGRCISVRGRQDLEIQGPRLNMTKEEKTSVQHGSDRRLEPVITPPMPLLEVRTHHPSSNASAQLQPLIPYSFSLVSRHLLYTSSYRFSLLPYPRCFSLTSLRACSAARSEKRGWSSSTSAPPRSLACEWRPPTPSSSPSGVRPQTSPQ